MNNGKIRNLLELPNHCKICLDPLDYNDEHDSIFCPSCDEWREGACSDPDCEYCLARPLNLPIVIDTCNPLSLQGKGIIIMIVYTS